MGQKSAQDRIAWLEQNDPSFPGCCCRWMCGLWAICCYEGPGASCQISWLLGNFFCLGAGVYNNFCWEPRPKPSNPISGKYNAWLIGRPYGAPAMIMVNNNQGYGAPPPQYGLCLSKPRPFWIFHKNYFFLNLR